MPEYHTYASHLKTMNYEKDNCTLFVAPLYFGSRNDRCAGTEAQKEKKEKNQG